MLVSGIVGGTPSGCIVALATPPVITLVAHQAQEVTLGPYHFFKPNRADNRSKTVAQVCAMPFTTNNIAYAMGPIAVSPSEGAVTYFNTGGGGSYQFKSNDETPDIRLVSAAPPSGSSVHASSTSVELTFEVTSPATGDFLLSVYPDSKDPTNRFFCAAGGSSKQSFVQNRSQLVSVTLNPPVQRWDSSRCPLPKTSTTATVSLGPGDGTRIFSSTIQLTYAWVP